MFVDIRDKRFSSIFNHIKEISPLAFNADFTMQVALTEAGDNLLRFFVFKSIKKENILSAEFEFETNRTAFKSFVKFGYLSYLYMDVIWRWQNLFPYIIKS